MRDGTPPNKEKIPFKQEEIPFKQGKHLQTRKNLSSKEKPFEQGKTFRARKTPPNKGKPFEQGKTPTNKGKHLSSKGNAFQARGIFQSNVEVYKW